MALAAFLHEHKYRVYVARPTAIVKQRDQFADSDSTYRGWAKMKSERSGFIWSD